MDPQAVAPFGLDRLWVPDLSFSACQPVLDVATQLLKLQQPQLILLLHQAQRSRTTSLAEAGSQVCERLLVLRRSPLLHQAGFQILQVEGFLLQLQGGCYIDA